MLAFDCGSDSDRWRAGCLSLGILQWEVRETTYRRRLTATVVFVSWLYKTRLVKASGDGPSRSVRDGYQVAAIPRLRS
jgi:hypothetical protein